jgi:nitrate/nitrite transporter NarK
MWSIPAGLFLVAFFHRNAPGVMARDLMEAFGVTGAVIGLLSATYFYSYAGFMIPAGMLIDAFGARRMVAAGGAVMGLGTLAMGAAAPPPALRVLVRGMGRVLANAHTWPVFLGFFCLYSAMGNLFLWAVPFLRDVYGLPTMPAAAVAAATSIARPTWP